MRADIQFDADGVTLRGWLYTPDGTGGPAPTVVMAHGFSAVKEMYLDRFAEAFANAGLASLVYDNRNFGASDGEPRQEIDPWEQVRDYRTAITLCHDTTRGRLRADRNLGLQLLRGSRAHGGSDRSAREVRRRAGAAHLRPRQLPSPGTGGFHRRLPGPVQRRPRGALPRRHAGHGARGRRGSPGALGAADPDSYSWFTETGASRAPSWRNEVTLRSVEMFTEYEPGTYLPWISPTPLLMCVAENDHLTVADIAIKAYEQAREPKRLVILPGGHFDAYVAGFDVASGAAVEWFSHHLLGRAG